MNFKTLFTILVLATLFFGCEKEQIAISDTTYDVFDEAKSTQGAFNANVSILDVRARTINETGYAKEMYFVSFDDYQIPEDGFIFSDMLYKDDGKKFDLVAGDGLFTAVTLQEFSKEVPFDQDVKVRSLLEKAIVSEDFFHFAKLMKMLKVYEVRPFSEAKIDVTLTCEITIEECPNENWWDTSWFGEPCLVLRNCTISVS